MTTVTTPTKICHLQSRCPTKGFRSIEVATHLVAVVADDLGEGHLPDLRELGFGESDQGIAVLVPEPVALPQVPELDADDAREGRTNEATVEGGL